MRHYLAVIFLLTLILPVAARADWQYTKWGMTKSEVEAACTSNQVQTKEGRYSNGTKAKYELEGSYKAGSFDFSAQFYFSGEGKLNMVSLVLQGDKGYELEQSLLAKYGNDYRKEFLAGSTALQMYRLIWRVESEGNVVSFIRLLDRYSVQYEPLKTDERDKL